MTSHRPHSPPNLVAVRRALLSVSDKTGIVEFARCLAGLGVEIISTGGTARALTEAGLRVTPIESVTGHPEMMDGRVKTLHPAIHGALLAVRDNPQHAASLRDHGVMPIDLVCVNLYPFERTVSDPEVTISEAVETIDIGGPSMVRSAAKNSDYVAVVTDPARYSDVIDSIRANEGSSTLELRRRLAVEAFALTARYDAVIAAYLSRSFSPASGEPREAPSPSMPDGVTLGLTLERPLRYGENPHQAAAMYVTSGSGAVSLGAGVPQARQVHGKDLSYNNVNDAAAALTLVGGLAMLGPGQATSVAACVVKHANPSGASIASTAAAAADQAIAGDPVAAYGGIVAISDRIDAAAAARLCAKDAFFEVIVAPGFDDEALDLIRARWTGIRLLEVGREALTPRPTVEFRSVPGGVLLQQSDRRIAGLGEIRHAAGPPPSIDHLASARFLEHVARALTSNAVCIGGVLSGGGLRLCGAGAGQMDRVAACRLAVLKAGDSAPGATAFSDAYFPFPDGPEVLIDAGVSCLVHPGGSRRDQETFDLCDARGVTCLVTGIRHFRH